ncbi:13286_t:CDS:1, partial [Cetraspora pellucida]
AEDEVEDREKEKVGNDIRSSNSICSIFVGFTSTFLLTFSFSTSILISVK